MSRRLLLSDPASRLPSDNTLSSSSSSNDVSPSIFITVIILAIAVILFASLYLLLRFLRRTRHQNTTAINSLSANASPPSLRKVSPVIDSLPLFTYDRLTAKNVGDCAVCLSKFENDDVLRLLPVCCHAFHADCIDTWLTSNMTCPLCRSPIFLPDNEIAAKINGERSRSFRVEIGNVSDRRRDLNSSATNSGEIRRSYSLGGAFDYVISEGDDAVADVTSSEYYKATDATTELESEQRGALAAEVGTRGGGGWLKDYLSTSSRTASFRSSGRWFFTGSSRRSNTVEVNELGEFGEVSRLGDEIGEMFRWLSGV